MGKIKEKGIEEFFKKEQGEFFLEAIGALLHHDEKPLLKIHRNTVDPELYKGLITGSNGHEMILVHDGRNISRYKNKLPVYVTVMKASDVVTNDLVSIKKIFIVGISIVELERLMNIVYTTFKDRNMVIFGHLLNDVDDQQLEGWCESENYN